MTRTTLGRDVCFTGVMTEARVSERSNLEMGEVGDRRSVVPMHVAMVMMTAATPTPTVTAGSTMVEPIERNKQGKWRRSSKAPVTPSNWMRHMERTMRQQAQVLMQLH
jgi:hypothetical protein